MIHEAAPLLETDSLYIELRAATSSATREIQDGVNVEFDNERKIVGFDSDNASANLDLSTLDAVALPVVKPSAA